MLQFEAERLKKIPPYLFARIDRLKEEEAKKGKGLISLGIGDPDQPTPPHIIQALKEAVDNPRTHSYPPYEGYKELREAISIWYKNRFEVELDPDLEILPLIGSKEGIAHIPFALLNSKDRVLVPDPGYPVYHSSTILAGGVPIAVPLLSENRFLPDLSKIDPKGAKLFFVNYPNNPTAATADISYLSDLVSFAKESELLICFDAAYSELYFEGIKPPCILQIKGGKDVAIEFHSLSKTYNMTGWRIGFACGNKDAIASLAKLKQNLDSGIFGAIQYAGIKALLGEQTSLEASRKLYERRRDVLVEGLKGCGFKVNKPQATFYLWVQIEGSSMDFTERLIRDSGVVVTPGIGFGEQGEGFIRFALTVDEEKLKEAVERISKISQE
ncbi:MAG: LL-diaminopimelate aminotransferase [bacterium]|nr:LL-diaminopimelate aminotransferase [bacterium]